MIHNILIVLCCLLAAGCGYHWRSESLFGQTRPLIAVPYVQGDGDGALTEEIIRALTVSGTGRLCQRGARYRLQAVIVRLENQMIGYRRDRQQINDQSKKNLVASEARRVILVETTLYDELSGKTILGPFQIDADVAYDYIDGDSIQDLVFLGPDQTNQVVLPFSLGQLESIESAQEAALRPLYARIAKKIIDVICEAW